MQTPPAIRFNSIEQVFPATTGAPTHALSGLDFTIGRHEFVSVLGPSGCHLPRPPGRQGQCLLP